MDQWTAANEEREIMKNETIKQGQRERERQRERESDRETETERDR